MNKFKEVNEAYQVLGNENKRAQYDAGGQGFDGFDFSNFDVKFSGGGGNFADIINSMFHGVINRGADVQTDMTISFEESVFGVKKTVQIPYRRKASETIEVPIPAGVESGLSLIHI